MQHKFTDATAAELGIVDARLIKRARDKLGDMLAHVSDTDVLNAYACWHVHCGGDWSQFHYMLSRNVRMDVYASRGEHLD